MPEYLSPGVYVEEVDTGSKPIEGVSTSTAAMVGVTERGPVNVPVLVTSNGEYTRIFGGRLNSLFFTMNGTRHCYLPHAVEGFFTNGGKRLFVTRVVPQGATASALNLHDRGGDQPALTMLLRPAREMTGTAAAGPPVYVLNVNNAFPGTEDLAPGNSIRIGTGSEAEYRIVESLGTAIHVPLNFPLSRRHDPDVSVQQINRVPDAFPSGAENLTLDADVAPGDPSITLNAAVVEDLDSLAADQLLEIGGQHTGEHRFIREVLGSAGDATRQVVLDSPVRQGYVAIDTTIIRLNATGVPVAEDSLSAEAGIGASVVFLNDLGGEFDDDESIVIFDNANTNIREARGVGNLNLLTLSTGAYGDYPASSLVEGVNLTYGALTIAADTNPADPTAITLSDADNLNENDTLRIDPIGVSEDVVIEAITDRAAGTITLQAPGLTAAAPYPADTPVAIVKPLAAAAAIGSTVITLDNRVELDVGDVIQIGDAPDDEYVTIRALPDRAPGGAPPDEGDVHLEHPLARAHAAGTTVILRSVAVNTDRHTSVSALDFPDGAGFVAVSDGTGYAADYFVRVTRPGGDVIFHRLATNVTPLNGAPVNLNQPLINNHVVSAEVAERRALMTVQALDVGMWGNRLRVSVEDERKGLLTGTTITSISGTTLGLGSVVGVERGTVLDVLNGDVMVGPHHKVREIDRSARTVVIDEDLSPEQQDLFNTGVAGLRSREFRMTVFMYAQPVPAMPFRDEEIIDTEIFDHLSMDPRHSRYIGTVVGLANVLPDDENVRLWDRRTEGESMYIRVNDLGTTAERESMRLGPETLVDTLLTGRTQAARHRLMGGNDSISNIIPDTYRGNPHDEPEQRTGIHVLRNVENISIVSCPGQTDIGVQMALIEHCENMRYRFAVLDGPRPPRDELADVEGLRQQYDTKYAALYHPWLLTPDPYPTNISQIRDYPIPPSGHMMGIYARTDVERGVHKAPANEVVRGVIGLQRQLNKSEHDMLNPYPKNINVIRDFRKNNRGIRVWGGRVITSDTDWKYVNVRRLLIFIEASIDRGLQWVVFEPNAEPLWARVTRSISNFLKVVWRNGALEGTKVEEAFFVKCDRTTMTQTDIDNGRLICVVGVAPVKPAEFVIIRIGLWTAYAEE